jgi:hypothetical protein
MTSYELSPTLILGTGINQLRTNLVDLASGRIVVIGRHGPDRELLPKLLARSFYEFNTDTPPGWSPVTFVAIDPAGSWKSLKTGADRLQACPEITIIGGASDETGPLGDAKSSGERIGTDLGECKAEAPKGVILDLSGYSPADKRKFVGSFLRTFCRARRQGGRALVHVFIDGAELFAQKSPNPSLIKQQQERCAHAVARFVARAKALGIGATVISPRFDAVDEGVAGRCDTFFIFDQEDGDTSLKQWLHVQSKDWPSLPAMACHYHHGRTNQLVCLEE